MLYHEVVIGFLNADQSATIYDIVESERIKKVGEGLFKVFRCML